MEAKMLKIHDGWVPNYRGDIYINFPKAQGTLWRTGQKECKNKRVGNDALNCNIMVMVRLLHPWTHNNYGYLYKIKSFNIIERGWAEETHVYLGSN